MATGRLDILWMVSQNPEIAPRKDSMDHHGPWVFPLGHHQKPGFLGWCEMKVVDEGSLVAGMLGANLRYVRTGI